MGLFLYLIFWIFILGICIGSFLNVVILRAFSNESIVFPASKCPKCQHKLKWYHNIPIFSYIFLRGKCAFCGEKISIQYPIIELFTGIVFVITFFKFGFTLNTIIMWLISSMFIVLTVTDLKEKVIFVPHAIIMTIFCLMLPLFNSNNFIHGLVNSFLGILLGILIMEILARIGYLFAGTRAFGEGDTYISAGLGALFGWKILPIVLILSLFVQFIITLPLFLFKLYKNKDYITILVFILFGASVILCKISQIPFAISIIPLFISAGLLCFKLLKDLRKEQDFMYLPFGPAMILSAFILLIFH